MYEKSRKYFSVSEDPWQYMNSCGFQWDVLHQWIVFLCFTSLQQRGHLETAPLFTVPCEGREARKILPGIEPRAVAWQSITLPLRHTSSTQWIEHCVSVLRQGGVSCPMSAAWHSSVAAQWSKKLCNACRCPCNMTSFKSDIKPQQIKSFVYTYYSI